MRVLVTGGSGFIGTNLVQRYLDAGVEVLNADCRPPRDPDHANVSRQVDFLDPAGVRGVFDDFAPTHVVHLAARTDLHGDAVSDYAVNVDGTGHVVDAARGCDGLERVLFASTRMVCRIGYVPRHDTDYCAPNAYGKSKVEGEERVRSAGLDVPWAIFRPTSIWGPWFEVPYRTFFDSVRSGRYVHPRGRTIHKSFGYVGNSVDQLDALLRAPAEQVHGRMFYLADAPPVEVLDMARRIKRAFGGGEVRTVPLRALRAAAKAGDVAQKVGWKEPPLTSFRLDNLLTEMRFDEHVAQLQEVTGPPRHDLDSAIAATVAWMRSPAGA